MVVLLVNSVVFFSFVYMCFVWYCCDCVNVPGFVWVIGCLLSLLVWLVV